MVVIQATDDANGASPREPARAVRPAHYSTFVHDTILKRWKSLASNEDPARRGEDIEALHDMRVASRRLRAALSVFAPYLPDKPARRAAKRLRSLTRLLGASREWDVHGEALARLHAAAARPDERAAIEHLLELVDARRGHERSAMSKQLDEVDLEKLGDKLRWLAGHVRSAGLPDDLPHAAAAALQALGADAYARTPELRDRERPEELHAMRVAVKRFRYALELLEPAFQLGYDELIGRAKALQEILGRHHDHCLLEDMLTRTLSRLTEHGRATLAAGLLGPIERLRAERHERFREFVTATDGVDVARIAEDVRVGLGLEAAASTES